MSEAVITSVQDSFLFLLSVYLALSLWYWGSHLPWPCVYTGPITDLQLQPGQVFICHRSLILNSLASIWGYV